MLFKMKTVQICIQCSSCTCFLLLTLNASSVFDARFKHHQFCVVSSHHRFEGVVTTSSYHISLQLCHSKTLVYFKFCLIVVFVSVVLILFVVFFLSHFDPYTLASFQTQINYLYIAACF